MIEHPQPALYRKIIVAQNIRPLHTKQQDHLRRPDTDALQAAQHPDDLLVWHLPDLLDAALPCLHLPGEVCDILRLAVGNAQLLQLGHPRRKDMTGVNGAEGLLHPLPDRFLRLGGNLLPDDLMHYR